MAHAVNLVVSCTNRKRYEMAPGLAVHEIDAANVNERIRAWKKRLSHVKSPEHPAQSMYMGDHWAIARSIPDDAAELGLSADEEQTLTDSLSAYRAGDLLQALAAYPGGRQPVSAVLCPGE